MTPVSFSSEVSLEERVSRGSDRHKVEDPETIKIQESAYIWITSQVSIQEQETGYTAIVLGQPDNESDEDGGPRSRIKSKGEYILRVSSSLVSVRCLEGEVLIYEPT